MEIPRSAPEGEAPLAPDNVPTIDGGELQLASPVTAQAIERATVSEQVATAHTYKRKMHEFKSKAIAMATMDIETAEQCHYCAPVGKEKNDRGEWVMKFAEGPSIRAAEIVAACYGNLRAKAFIVQQTERYVTCEGQAWDLEGNYAASVQASESTITKKGEPYSERQRARTAKALMSKVYRDAVFKVVPRAMCKTVLDAAKLVAAKAVKSMEERRARAKSWVTTIKIDNRDARVFAALGIASWDEALDEHLTTLTGLKTAIADGELKWEEAFPPLEETTPSAAAHLEAQEKGKASTPVPSNLTPRASRKAKVVETPPTPEKPATEPPAAAAPPSEAAPKAPEPEVKPEALTVPETAGPAGADRPQTVTPTMNRVWQSDEAMSVIKDIEELCKEYKVTGMQLKNYLRKIKVMKDIQKSLSDLATTKLLSVRSTFSRMAGEIAKEPQ